MLQNAEIISEEQMDLNVVKPGTTVTILDLSLDDPEEEKYTIVGSFETDPVNGKISNESPLASALPGVTITPVFSTRSITKASEDLYCFGIGAHTNIVATGRSISQPMERKPSQRISLLAS